MDFEQLHLRTVELLASRVGECSLPPLQIQQADTQESVSGATEGLLAESLAAALRDARAIEMELVEKQQAPEIGALRSNMQRLNLLKERMENVNKVLSELRTSYDSVTARTSSLHNACERALAAQTALTSGAEQIKANLYFFKQADFIIKKLSNTGKLLVTGQAFASILASIDECLSFLRLHPEYRESAAYITKYEQCLSRAMTWIRIGVLADLDVSMEDVRNRQSELQIDYAKIGRVGADEDTFNLLYGVFASRANSIKSSFAVAEQRFAKLPEFQSMLAECQTAYFTKRRELLDPIIQATLARLAKLHGDSSCALTRNGCTFILRLCDDEFHLYKQFFSVSLPSARGSDSPLLSRTGRHSPTHSLISQPVTVRQSISVSAEPSVHPFEEFAESISRLLYDVLRPIVVHNPHLETLAELCTILKVEMIEERCSLMSSLVSGISATEEPAFDPRAGFVTVISELVGDVAERIVYRAGLYAQSDIVGFSPAPGDLAYPERLEMIRNIEKGQSAEANKFNTTNEVNNEHKTGEKDSVTIEQSKSAVSAVDLHCLWYPTVRRTVMCLAKLFRCLDMGVFQSLARDLLSMCCDSLDEAAAKIAAQPVKKTTRSKQLDAELFVVKHLLILREQTTPYRHAATQRADATLPTKDFSLDLSKFKSVIFDESSKWFALSSNNTLLELITTVPVQVSETSGDSRRVIDSRLRTRCNQLIATTADLVVGPLLRWTDIAEDEGLKPDFDLSKHPSLAASELRELSSAAFKALGTLWPDIRKIYSLYIGVSETEGILLSPVRKRIADTFARAWAFASKRYDDEMRGIAALPSVQQIYLLLNKDS